MVDRFIKKSAKRSEIPFGHFGEYVFPVIKNYRILFSYNVKRQNGTHVKRSARL